MGNVQLGVAFLGAVVVLGMLLVVYLETRKSG